MPIRRPEHPLLANDAERVVWDALVRQLGDGDLVAAGLRVTDHLKDHEIDFVLALEGHGIACLEVKGGQVWHDGFQWVQARQGKDRSIDPVRQVMQSCYALRRYVEADPRWTQGRLRWDHFVVLPNTEVRADFALPECPRWKVIDRNDLGSIAERLRAVLDKQELDRPALVADGVDQFAEVLAGRGLPQRDVVSRAVANEDAADRLTEQQAVILDATRLLTRVEVRGGAGTGKTFLALEQARRLAEQHQRIALICYSHGLASYLQRITATWNRKKRPAYVGEFHALGRLWGAAEGPDEALRTADTVRFWEHDLPAQMTELARSLPEGQRFDAVVVDEAQDFADAWWDPIMAALRDEETSGIYVFTDEAQRVFDREGRPPVPLVPLVLDHNLRNTRQIAGTFGPLVGQRMRLLGGDGPDVQFVACRGDEALAVADDRIDALLEEGWRPGDVALLATGSRHPEQVARQSEGNSAYWDSFWDTEQVYYGHVLGFKGLERRAVVLAVNETQPQERSRERLYVGLSRARDQLVVCGDPDFVRQVGGPELAARLGIGR
ncbi:MULTISPECIES: ATP-binding domain-containing protein [Rhodococcus]|uniref:nuclease-related domain-containing DEAD/DEAH box helicase n=1 Tax=Rhodococcus TaxID=1827 RepID=UPI00193BBAE1|nr:MULTISPECIES: ATP-binding domain-containing protein [Rhodococcus]QRI75160.1 NERD domain-containing protein [Rhodococcus aetherivorans]QSE58568.1 NERD domain-containing protein [Rhodococcus sp. PSBB066]QSE70107.1 NERD domain-containing protein [Rhodococcus sp. PSBB049]